jgi:hypothetical protein
MKITIEISEEDAASLWADYNEDPRETIESIIGDQAKAEAAQFRRTFPNENIPALTERYRQHLASLPPTPKS